MTHVWGVLTEHGGVASCIVGVSAASQNQEAKEKPPLHGDPAPQMKHFPPLHGDPAPQMKHFPPLHGDPAPQMKHFPPLHGDPAPQMKHFPPLHGIDRAIMKFSSPTHTQNAQFPTIFTVLGRYFFHRDTPHDHTVLRRGDISFIQPLEAPPAWRGRGPGAPHSLRVGRRRGVRVLFWHEAVAGFPLSRRAGARLVGGG